MPLQSRNLNRLLVVPMHHARTLAQHLHRARPRATPAKNIGIQNRVRRALQIPRGYFLNEARHIDMCRAGASAWSIEAIETTVCFNHGSLLLEGRMQIAEAFNNLGSRHCLLVKGNFLAHVRPITSDPES